MLHAQDLCGCRCVRAGEPKAPGDWTIVRCPLHAAAPRLLDALRHFVRWDVEPETALKIARELVTEISPGAPRPM